MASYAERLQASARGQDPETPWRVNTEVDVPALDMELRHVLDAIELALDTSGRPLRVLNGEFPRSDLLSPVLPLGPPWRRSGLPRACDDRNGESEEGPHAPLPFRLDS
ncbi:hypothetical protein DICSQDRAFT_181858 [Dichomitus squalens LYAD-421 SS1]|uniref:Uncharacterized protein n=1 Tax=Dichomitus squalens (strain LYAD-421) TaxID=732165 RepID=R7SUN9_DICSQ|nr:uncharacterized protein DICSQDRAFT_181858 [Dichomitus squalens LYAD-421 SS1]EJF59490.1 hypothetical protein DICSQDRAFT_181858 [Dichomitus squalens LYAD-421 SS1]